jgi:hypothetical protein
VTDRGPEAEIPNDLRAAALQRAMTVDSDGVDARLRCLFDHRADQDGQVRRAVKDQDRSCATGLSLATVGHSGRSRPVLCSAMGGYVMLDLASCTWHVPTTTRGLRDRSGPRARPHWAGMRKWSAVAPKPSRYRIAYNPRTRKSSKEIREVVSDRG